LPCSDGPPVRRSELCWRDTSARRYSPFEEPAPPRNRRPLPG
jgi:hypothetical protein